MLCYVLYSYHMYILFLVPHLYQPVAEGVFIVNNNNNNNNKCDGETSENTVKIDCCGSPHYLHI